MGKCPHPPFFVCAGVKLYLPPPSRFVAPPPPPPHTHTQHSFLLQGTHQRSKNAINGVPLSHLRSTLITGGKGRVCIFKIKGYFRRRDKVGLYHQHFCLYLENTDGLPLIHESGGAGGGGGVAALPPPSP